MTPPQQRKGESAGSNPVAAQRKLAFLHGGRQQRPNIVERCGAPSEFDHVRLSPPRMLEDFVD